MTEHGFNQAFERISQLAGDFEANADFYFSKSYQEAQVRKDFIDKFFIALGWDVNHDVQSNPFEQEVKVERPVSVGATQRRADYAFHVTPNFRDPRFLVEAKKPSSELVTPDNYFQTIRYGWNKQNLLAGLTDFANLHVLDCRYKPDIDTAIHRCVKKYSFADYLDREKFAEIYWLLSREAVANGSLEKFADKLPRPRGGAKQRSLFAGAYLSIDESFLVELDDHRKSLAHAFKSRNSDLDSDTLTEATQRTLDRLVFMRFLEDKLIEPSHFVAGFGERGTAWEDFIATSRRLDGTYNGIVFKKHALLDSPDFRIDDHAFGDVCEKLSHKNSPYDFNAIPIHILGSIYERFLGNVIVATDKRVRLEQKPEVRKAGGVYYTPDYIVRYIVENTVGVLIAGKSPDEIAKMRFADIACGSGSFLLGVYDLLLRYHAQYYNDHPRKARKNDCVEKDGVLHLTLERKREILLDNIYGVDLDPQAVEVTQLSLYLKLLDEETIASARGYQLRMHAAILPPLNKNIVCGNSLVATDILDEQLFPSDEERKLNPMNFDDHFSDIIRQGGFDAIVGNPPWGASFSTAELAYLRGKFQNVIARMIDSYIYFVDRALRLLTKNGLLGYIIPSTVLNQVDAKPIRRVLLSRRLSYLISLGSGIFGSKVLNTSTILVTAKSTDGSDLVLEDLSKLPLEDREKGLERKTVTKWKQWHDLVSRDTHLTFFVNSHDATSLLMRLREKHPHLGGLTRSGIQRGISPDIAEAHVVSKAEAKKLKLEKDLLRISVSGGQIKRYHCWSPDQFIIYTTRETSIKEHPNALKHLEKFRHLNSCPEVKDGKHPWWALHRPRDSQIFASPKIVGLTTSKTIELIYDPESSVYVTDAMYVFSPPMDWEPWTFIAIMQSRLFLFLYRTANQGESRIIPQVKASKLQSLPVPSCPATHPKSGSLSRFAQNLVEANTKLAQAKTDRDKNYFLTRCASIDRQIDALVFELYGLSAAEIAVVEASNQAEVDSRKHSKRSRSISRGKTLFGPDSQMTDCGYSAGG